MAIIRRFDNKKKEEEGPDHLLVKLEKERRKSEGHDESNWLISYADMMTLLCVFYIMLFSMSKMNAPEFEKAKKEMAKDFKTEYKAPAQELGKFMTQILQEAGVEKNAVMSSDGTSISIAFHSTMFFDTLSAELRPEGQKIMESLITKLDDRQKAENNNYKIVVEGHTDSQAVLGGPFASNWELSSSRASRVIRLFVDKGFHSDNLLAMGFADTRPVAPSRNADGTWNVANLARNRRVVLRVLMPNTDSIPWKMDGDNANAPVSETVAAAAATEVKPADAAVAAGETTPPVAGVAAVPVQEFAPTTEQAAVPSNTVPTNGAPTETRAPASAPQGQPLVQDEAGALAKRAAEAAAVADAVRKAVRVNETVLPGKR